MVDQDVVDVLAEIKQRVIASQATSPTPQPLNEATHDQVEAINVSATRDDYAGLTVLARAWNRLPPLVSKRTGAAARLELWIKAKAQRALRWFTWEQVNFNAATHQTFLDLVESLALHREQLLVLQKQLTEESNARQELHAEIIKSQERIERCRTLLASQEANLMAQQVGLRAVSTEISEIKSYHEEISETKARLDVLINEIRERDERSLDEQRVCFKQLSLELSESQILQDRARRELDQRVTKLEKEAK